MEELAKADKLEQMNQQRRRMKLHNHRKKVEELWHLKKQKILEEEREREKQRRGERARMQREEQLIREQKELLVRTHLPFIEGFCSTELTNLAKGRIEPRGKGPSKMNENRIFGVSMDRIEQWEKNKENRKMN